MKLTIVRIFDNPIDGRITITFKQKHKFKIDDQKPFKVNNQTLLLKVLSIEDDYTIKTKKFDPYMYVWTNNIYESQNIYKVGVTNWQTVIDRVKQQDTTGVVEAPVIVESYPINVKTPKEAFKIETTIHNNLKRCRNSREFFQNDFKSEIDPTIKKVIKKFETSKSKLNNIFPIPRYYQYNCSELALQHYSIYDKGQIQWTCGTGKTKEQFWIYNQIRLSKIITNPTNTVVILVPSRQLVYQTLECWEEMCKSHNIKLRNIICLGDAEGQTEPQTIANFIKQSGNTKINLIISTYQSYKCLRDAIQLCNIIPDFTIYDEAHRVTGNKGKDWIKCIMDSYIPSKKKLFMTASPIYYTNESVEFIGMNNESIYGKVFHEYHFKDAVLDGYITPLQILALQTTNHAIDEIKSLIKENKLINIKGMFDDENSYTTFAIQLHNTLVCLKKGIFTHPLCYSNTISRIEKFIFCLEKLAPKYKVKINYSRVFTGKDKIEKRIEQLDGAFSEAKIAVAGNAKSLQEGISINSVDGIVLIDPKSSAPDIIQIIGRPVRLHKDKKIASILLPMLYNHTNEGQLILDENYFSTTRDIMLNIAMCNSDLHNTIVEGEYEFVSDDFTRKGITQRHIIENEVKTKNISGVNRTDTSLKEDIIPFQITIKQLIKSVEQKVLYSVNTKALKREEPKGQLEYKQLYDYTKDFEIPIENALTEFKNKTVKKRMIKQFGKLIKTKDEHISDFAQQTQMSLKDSSVRLSKFLIKNEKQSKLLFQKIYNYDNN